MFFKEKRELKAEVKRLTKRIAVLNKEVARTKETSGKIETERDKLRKMVREQTEADLLVNAMKGVGLIKADTVVNYDAFANQRRLADLQGQAAAMNTSMCSGLGGLGQSLLGMRTIRADGKKESD